MDALKQLPVPRQSALGTPFLPSETPLPMLPCQLDRTAEVGRAPVPYFGVSSSSSVRPC
ncbi:hypothetical protein [Bradyrhizobium sp. 177]|uniref:hypothetical protein n=1 Tax=Bradyrhizobium sp. 177 TaxID=2782647 RepID=UPI001FF9C4B0|nr:hypothetical protein [Bradyrhizobium sp. 177]